MIAISSGRLRPTPVPMRIDGAYTHGRTAVCGEIAAPSAPRPSAMAVTNSGLAFLVSGPAVSAVAVETMELLESTEPIRVAENPRLARNSGKNARQPEPFHNLTKV